MEAFDLVVPILLFFIVYFSLKVRRKQFRMFLQHFKTTHRKQNKTIIPKSVNYHFTRVCNYSCGFCFHTAKNSYLLPLNDAKIGLQMLKNAGK